MRITIHWKGDTLDFGALGKVQTTNIVMNTPVRQAFKKVGWRNWWKIRKIEHNKPFKCKWTVEAAEELKLMSCDLEDALIKMMSDEMNAFKVQQDLEYIDRHLGEWPEEVIKQNADKIRQLEDQDALDQLKRLNEKITIDNPDELHVKVPGDRIYPTNKE